MKFLTIEGQTTYMIGIALEDDVIVMETPETAYLVSGLKDTNKFVERVANLLNKDVVEQITISDSKEVEGTLNTPVVYLNDYGTPSIEIVSRYGGVQSVITDFGLYEINSTEFNLEGKDLRINVAGEYNDIRCAPQRGTTYKQVEEILNTELENNKVLNLKTTDGVVIRGKIKFKVDYI